MIRIRRLLRDDTGIALPTVLGVAMVLLVICAICASFTVGGLRKSRTDADWNAALAAAYGGAEEYASRLTNDVDYRGYGNPASAFTIAAGSVGTVKMPPAAKLNPAFDVTSAGSWGSLPGSSGRALFRYEVDNSQYSAKGAIRIRATGKVGQSVRSIVVDVKQNGFINFLYFTNYEFMDPLYDTSCTSPAFAYADGNNSTVATGCTAITFPAADVLTGPVHSNDTIRFTCGAQFNGAFTTGDSTKPKNYYASCSTPTKTPTTVDPVPMPATNASMKAETAVDTLTTTVPNPGCRYTGPTQITFNTNGTMTVVSPWTIKFTQPSDIGGGSVNNEALCGKLTELQSAAGSTVAVPANNLIYVQKVPATASGDPNAPVTRTIPGCTPASSAACKTITPVGFTCGSSNGGWSTTTDAGWTFTTGSGASLKTVRYPIANESVPTPAAAGKNAYDCKSGDVFVSGTLDGSVTVAAQNNVYVTGDLVYKGSDDVLGLVGEDSVWVWNPMNGSTPLLAKNRTINAAILSVLHTFQVQNYSLGASRGTLTINGAIAQKFRGIVIDGSSGYVKAYSYDERFKNIAPPKFLLPATTTYGITQYADTKAAFKSTGAPN